MSNYPNKQLEDLALKIIGKKSKKQRLRSKNEQIKYTFNTERIDNNRQNVLK